MHVPSLMDMARQFMRRTITDTDAASPDPDSLWPSNPADEDGGDEPLRGEILSTEQLQRHARAVAATHQVRRARVGVGLLDRLADNEHVLVETRALVAGAVGRGRRVAPAAVWLLDNFYLIEEQIRSTRRLLPRRYLEQLPTLGADGVRTYRIALELVNHTDGRVDSAVLDSFITAYQTIAPLTIGELWAMPLMLRLALIENLRRVARRLGTARRHRDLAADWAEQLLDASDSSPAELVVTLADMTRASPPLSGAYLAEFTRLLQGHGRAYALVATWLEHSLVGHGMTVEQLVLAEGRAQAADQVSVGNSIGSLRFLGVHDWREFVAAHSVVEHVLATDPAGEYVRMDFATRNRYRTCVESIARRTRQAEADVAQRAVMLAHERAATAERMPREAHVGYWLIDAGRARLMASLGDRRPADTGCGAPTSHGAATLAIFLSATAALTLVAYGVFCVTAGPSAGGLVVGLPLALVALHLAVGLVTWGATLVTRPHPLPRLDFRDGIPADHATLVAIPAMLTDAATVARLLEDVELRYLANRDRHLYFALLSDLTDADTATLPTDGMLVRQATAGIAALNERYASTAQGRFLLLHRDREWNDRDRVWMGRERKRGKLAALNAVLRGDGATGSGGEFATCVGATSVLSEIRHVITLDADTDLPPDTARRLVGAMAHILNRPVVDPASPRVAAGHGILQPRMATRLTSAGQSLFSRLMAGAPGIDPYTRVVSDLYQDLFDEGSFIGKGIYDVDAFERCCRDFPANTILSHDLLEGCYCRSGFESDVVLHEDHPSSYLADSRRRHRWIRGDWQILWWLLPRVPSSGAWVGNPLSALSQWKILDNLRRSLVPPAMVAALVVGWITGSPRLMRATAGVVLAATLLPPLLAGVLDFLRKPHDVPLMAHLRAVAGAARKPVLQGFFWLAMLPHEASVALDAIVRTLVRMFLTRRRLLEWRTAADTDRTVDGALMRFAREMMLCPLLAGAVLAALWARDGTEALAHAGPWLAAWFVAPCIAWWVSRPLPAVAVRLATDDRSFLAAAGRRTWRYFEEFATARTHWLPPDNVQLDGEATVAQRTSPTNVAMGLLSDLTARDFGWCSEGRCLDRIRHSLETMDSLERHQGHLFNWYDIQTLEPLAPRYVSTVDSGNLMAGLLVLATGLEELADAPIPNRRIFAGLRDTLAPVTDAGSPNGSGTRTVSHGSRRLHELLAALARRPAAVATAVDMLPAVIEAARAAGHPPEDDETRWWINRLQQAASDHLEEIKHLCPWAALPPAPEQLWQRLAGEPASCVSRVREELDRLLAAPSLRAITVAAESLRPLIERLEQAAHAIMGNDAGECLRWIALLRTAIEDGARHAARRLGEIRRLAEAARRQADLDFGFLFDPSRRLLAIGYNATEHRLDAGYYDLLASEARLTSYVLVARKQFDQDHWFALGRTLTTADGAATLLSWSGSMFEYLMPLLVMPSWRGTLLDHSCRAAVHNHIGYARQRGVPWGISESGYSARDAQLNYQYRAFGVPGLGLKRGLADDLVIAPYASALALLVEPVASCDNLRRIAAAGGLGRYGFVEAIDFTPSRRPASTFEKGIAPVKAVGEGSIVRQFMAHHQGMSLLAYAAVLFDAPMQRRFLADPALRSASLLLQERIPKLSVTVVPHPSETAPVRGPVTVEDGAIRRITDFDSPLPEMQLLSNGRYHVAISAVGGGWSRWQGLAITRWRGDATRDAWGQFCYLRDVDDGYVWSTTWQPTTRGGAAGEAVFMQSRAEFRRLVRDIEAHTLVSVSPEDDVELRRLSLTNRSERPRSIEVTSYAEVVLAPQLQDESHPAFSNLFVETEALSGRPAILARRRPRQPEEQSPWLVHLMAGNLADEEGGSLGPPMFETDRLAFIGRGRTPRSPAALARSVGEEHLGATLDPVVSIRRTILLEPGATVRLDIVTGASVSREAAAAIAAKYCDTTLSDRVIELAWTRGAILLQQLAISEREAQAFGRLAGALLHGAGPWRGRPDVVARNRRGQSGLWGHGVSGDLPIVLVRIRARHSLELVQESLRAHAWWRMHGLDADLVIWNEDESVYRQELHETIVGLVAASTEAGLVDRPAGVFVRRGEQLSEEDRLLLEAAARVVLGDDSGSLIEQAERRVRTPPMPPLKPRARSVPTRPSEAAPPPPLTAFNGLGGFTADGAEYVIHLAPDATTPAPWVNCLANPRIGTVVSETGSACTWVDNSHEYRLTPWVNDPVCDAGGEALYIRDEESGRFWSPCPYPARGCGNYTIRHNACGSTFTHDEDGILTELTVFVDEQEPVKFLRLTFTNDSGRPRALSVIGYWEWVLGELRSRSGHHVVTEIDPLTGALLARTAFAADFADMVAFVDASEMARSVTGDRVEFIGRNGSLAAPAALNRTRLSGRVGACLDPCAAMQVQVLIDAGERRSVMFTLGAASSLAEVQRLIQACRGEQAADRRMAAARSAWQRRSSAVQVECPDASVAALVNHWLPHQIVSCRLWGRTATYQSSGGYGFRDQLQDAMGLALPAPELLREHLLRAASRQFEDGDVQHWWHPPGGRGVRTHCADDYLWLPAAVCHYVQTTDDTGVLDQPVPFLQGRRPRADEESAYEQLQPGPTDATLYEHCIRALEHALSLLGGHGLPLFQGGDWNDGMNLVGRHGRGESVWLAFFLYDVLRRFTDLAERRGDVVTADRCAIDAGRLRGNIEEHAWDGGWYLRGWFDDGLPLGSASSAECRIDAVVQSWAALSAAATHARAVEALDSVGRMLISPGDRLVRLLTPPFDAAPVEPGYIKGYPPGVRENGGQYTHAAVWTAMAFAVVGDHARAWDVFRLINPVSHGDSPERIATYRVEPYVLAGDILAAPPHTGRGGWTWYTGSAGWMYRLLVETLLGVERVGTSLRLSPHPPREWPRYTVRYRHHTSTYVVKVYHPGHGLRDAGPIRTVHVDGVLQPDAMVPLVDDGAEHVVDIELT